MEETTRVGLWPLVGVDKKKRSGNYARISQVRVVDREGVGDHEIKTKFCCPNKRPRNVGGDRVVDFF
jgi:hypothetical protein